MKLSQASQSLTQTVLIYGPPKVGKTQLAGELAKHGKKLIWFDLENGVSTLLKLPPEAQENIELIVLPDTRSFPIAIETCLKVIKGTPVEICEAHGKVGCLSCKKDGKPSVRVALNELDSSTVVVFDSLTQLTNSGIAFITKDKPDDYKLNYDDWGNLGKLMDTFLSHVQQAKFNVICISHEAEVELEDGKVKLVPVAGTRAFSRNTAKYFGHVVYAQVSLKKHTFISSTTGGLNIITGSRTDVVTDKMESPSLISIFNSQYVAPQTNGQIAASGLASLLGKK
jgi:hypothetical protein